MANDELENIEETGIEADATENLPEVAENTSSDVNMIQLDASAYPDAKDGDVVSTTVEGKLSIIDGVKFLTVTTADGKPVVSGEVENEESEMSDEDLESAIGDMASQMGGPKGYMAK